MGDVRSRYNRYPIEYPAPLWSGKLSITESGGKPADEIRQLTILIRVFCSIFVILDLGQVILYASSVVH